VCYISNSLDLQPGAVVPIVIGFSRGLGQGLSQVDISKGPLAP
jgi:hypothetical protein